jgi:hypothetical protein
MLWPLKPRRWFPHGRWRRGQKPASLLSDVTLVTGGSRCKPALGSPPPSNEQHHGEASSPTSKPLPQFNRKHHRGVSPHTR